MNELLSSTDAQDDVSAFWATVLLGKASYGGWGRDIETCMHLMQVTMPCPAQV